MNHDASHCSDWKKSCPKKCYRARLTKEFLEGGYEFPVSFVHFKDTKYCQQRINRIKRRIKEALTMKISGILIDVSKPTGSIKEYTLDEMSLEDFYKALHCDTIDITVRTVNGIPYAFVCDDEGLLKGKKIPTAFDSDGKAMLVGNLFIANAEGAHLKSLSKDDVHAIMNAAKPALKFNSDGTHDVYPALMDVGYVG